MKVMKCCMHQRMNMTPIVQSVGSIEKTGRQGFTTGCFQKQGTDLRCIAASQTIAGLHEPLDSSVLHHINPLTLQKAQPRPVNICPSGVTLSVRPRPRKNVPLPENKAALDTIGILPVLFTMLSNTWATAVYQAMLHKNEHSCTTLHDCHRTRSSRNTTDTPPTRDDAILQR